MAEIKVFPAPFSLVMVFSNWDLTRYNPFKGTRLMLALYNDARLMDLAGSASKLPALDDAGGGIVVSISGEIVQ